jgi:hypothetical protein
MTQGHPSWCDRPYCTATGFSGAHRSSPVSVAPEIRIRANVYATSTAPDETFIEIRCEQRLIPARAAYGLGRLLVTLAKKRD